MEVFNMNARTPQLAALLTIGLIGWLPANAQTALSQEFTYQGRLVHNGAPVAGPTDMRFRLLNSNGEVVAGPLVFNGTAGSPAPINVDDGLFAATLNFGAESFNGDALWLAIEVRHPTGSGSYTTLPAQPLHATPYALQTRGIFVDAAQRVGIGTTNPQTPFALRGNGGTNDVGITQNAFGGASTMELTTADGAGSQASRIVLRGGSDTADVEFLRGASGAEEISMKIEGNTGFVGIGETNPTTELDVAGTITATTLEAASVVASALGVASTATNVASFSGSSPIGTWLSIENTSTGGSDWQIISTGSGNGEGAGKLLFKATGGGNVAMTLDEQMASVRALQITGGSDIAEPFNVRGTTAARPGMVVSLDPNNVGELRVARSAYDHTVAGIISGANGVNPGLTLTQAGSVADGKHPVALTGRVWCLVDAEANGPVHIGDLLTTSETPGHAMRVADHARAAGAVIGKAMSALPSGRGYVLVLVSLQ
jgi:hypothetical protein